jgi:ATP-dependent DNA helicase RecQ
MNVQASDISYEDAQRVLRHYWGHDDFRPGQWDIIRTALEGRDLLAILPTGGGKSVCYQVPALLCEGLTIVISPLIALMQDQVGGLRARGVEAAFINSSLSIREIDQRWADAEHGKYRLLYLAPERLQSEMFVARASRLNVSLLAVDEAHCISEWGHNFRPSYLEIASARKTFGDPPTVAVTATATPRVRDDVIKHLALRNPEVMVRGFDRPNVVWSIFSTENKRKKVLDVLNNVPGSGIVYSATRRGVEEWSDWLRGQNQEVATYHGGLNPSVRELMQDAWLSGEKRVMVATNAFGMGIDKPDVRFVVHVDLPGTLEGYYQEAGRGGRDGKTSYAVLLYHKEDEHTPRALIDDSHPTAKQVRQTYDAACNLAQVAIAALPKEPIVLRAEAIAKLTGFSAAKVRTAVELLERQGAWSVLPIRKNFGLIRFTQPADDVRAYAARLTNESLGSFVEELLRIVHAEAFSTWWELDLRMLERRTGLELKRLLKGLDFLRDHQLFDWQLPERSLRIQFLEARSAKIPVDGRKVKAARERAENQLADMIRYARSSGCRRHFLLTYFGEKAVQKCGSCDVCLGRHEPFVVGASDEPILNQILNGVASKEPRKNWSLDNAVPPYRVDQLVAWLMREGYLTPRGPLRKEMELTAKGRRFIHRSANA